MTDIAMWAGVVGFFSPLVIAFIQQPKWATWVRAVVTFLFAAGTGAATAALGGDLTGKTWLTAGLIIFTIAISTFKGLWSQIGATQKIEHVTSPESKY